MSPVGLVNLRGRDGKRRQQTREQGSEKAEEGEAEGIGDGQFWRGETALARREEEVTLQAGEHGARPRLAGVLPTHAGDPAAL